MRSALAGRLAAGRPRPRRPQPRLQPPRASDLVLPVPRVPGRQAGLVLVPGFHISSAAYRPVLQAVQRAAEAQGLALHAGCAHLDWAAHPLMQPGDLKGCIDSVAQAMHRRGLRQGAPVFHAAHSLSSVFLQDYLLQGRASAGQILLGSGLLRKHCHPVFNYGVPTLTVGAELDGQEHASRQAEQYCVHRQLDGRRFPMVVLEGQTHMQFASGSAPAHLRQELPPAVPEKAAHEAVAEVVVDFIRVQLGERGAGSALQRQSKRTQALLLPMLLSMEHAANSGSATSDTAFDL